MRIIPLTALCLALSGGVALADHPRGHGNYGSYGRGHGNYGSYGRRGWSGAPTRSYYNSGYRYPGYNYGYNTRYRYPSYGYNHGYNRVYPYRTGFGVNIGLGYPGYGYDYNYPAYGYGAYGTPYAGSGSWVWDGYQWVWVPAVSGYVQPY